MSDRPWCQKGEEMAPLGEDHTYQYKECECVLPCLCQEEVGLLWGGGKGLLEVEGQGFP